MKLPGRQLMAKAIFAVAVVATTATVGIVGFAQAAKPAQNGYGGIDQLIAAINEFRQSVLAATTQYRQDVNVCLGGPTPLSAQAAPQAGRAQPDAVKENFNHRLDQSIGKLNANVGDSRSAEQGSGAFEQTYKNTTGQVFAELNGAQDQLAADMGVKDKATAKHQHGGELFQCLDRAQDKYQKALDTAKAKLLAAIRRILG
jgi:hypothetical protein